MTCGGVGKPLYQLYRTVATRMGLQPGVHQPSQALAVPKQFARRGLNLHCTTLRQWLRTWLCWACGSVPTSLPLLRAYWVPRAFTPASEYFHRPSPSRKGLRVHGPGLPIQVPIAHALASVSPTLCHHMLCTGTWMLMVAVLDWSACAQLVYAFSAEVAGGRWCASGPPLKRCVCSMPCTSTRALRSSSTDYRRRRVGLLASCCRPW